MSRHAETQGSQAPGGCDRDAGYHPGRRSGIRLRSPAITGALDDRKRVARRDAILAVVGGKLPGEGLRAASVRLLGHDLWASVVERPPPRRRTERGTPEHKERMSIAIKTGCERKRVHERKERPAAAIKARKKCRRSCRAPRGSKEYSDKLSAAFCAKNPNPTEAQLRRRERRRAKREARWLTTSPTAPA